MKAVKKGRRVVDSADKKIVIRVNRQKVLVAIGAAVGSVIGLYVTQNPDAADRMIREWGVYKLKELLKQDEWEKSSFPTASKAASEPLKRRRRPRRSQKPSPSTSKGASK
jgi:hypothetical protein